MSMKRFRAKDMRSAFTQIKDALGDDAIILGHKNVPGGVEIEACLPNAPLPTFDALNDRSKQPQKDEESSVEHDIRETSKDWLSYYGQAPKASQSNQVVHNPKQELTREELKQIKLQEQPKPNPIQPADNQVISSHSKNNAKLDEQSPTEVISALKDEITLMKTFMSKQFNELNQGKRRPKSESISANQMEIETRLEKMGFESKLIQSLVKLVNDSVTIEQAWKMVVSILIKNLKTTSGIETPGVYAWVGASGAGKTTSLMKAVTNLVMQKGADDMVIITTDQYRLASQEQLCAFASILKIPLKVLLPNESLADVLNEYKHKAYVFIDTAGLPYRGGEFEQQYRQLLSVKHQLNTFYVLDATAQSSKIKQQYRLVKGLKPFASIVTKCDDADTLGEALGCLIQFKLPIAYVSKGQDIPEDLQMVSSKKLINHMIKKITPKKNKKVNQLQNKQAKIKDELMKVKSKIDAL